MRHRFGPILVLLAASTMLLGCGEDQQAEEPTTPRPATDDAQQVLRFAAVGDGEESALAADPEVRRETIAVFERRLDALGIDAEVAAVEGTIEVRVPRDDVELVTIALQGTGRAAFRPVLSLAAQPSADESSSSVLVDEDGVAYELGDAGLDGTIIETAAATEGPGGDWTVALVLHEGSTGIEAFNTLVGSCFRGDRQCPDLGHGAGQLAIIVDDLILTAPTIHAERFERDQIVISGDFSEAEAVALAAELSAGASPLTFAPLD